MGGLLGLLDATELADLRARGRRRRYARGAIVFHEGADSDSVVGLLRGRVKVSSFSAEGREVVLALRGPGEVLGDLSAIDGRSRSATVTAVEAVDALVVPTGEFRRFLTGQPRVSLLLLEMLTERLRDADRKRLEFGAYDTTGRLARRLIELADDYGVGSDAGLTVPLPLSQEELAAWVGSSREAVSKGLRSFRERGWIETGRKRVVILDIEALRRRGS